MLENPVRKRFLTDLLLVVVTLGFYMPYWLFKRNRQLRELAPDFGLRENAWFLAGGGLLAAGGRLWMGFDSNAEAAIVSSVGVVVFLVGAFILAHNVERLLLELEVEVPIKAFVFTIGIGVGWFATELGNVFQTPFVRVPAVLLILAQPFLFYRLHEGIEIVWQVAMDSTEAASASAPIS